MIVGRNILGRPTNPDCIRLLTAEDLERSARFTPLQKVTEEHVWACNHCYEHLLKHESYADVEGHVRQKCVMIFCCYCTEDAKVMLS